MQMIEDRMLIWRFNRGDKTAFERIYFKYKDDLFRFVLAMVNNVDFAEDLLQDIFVQFAKAKGTFKLTGSLRGYLMVCIANRARHLMRAMKHDGRSLIEGQEVGDVFQESPEEYVSKNEEFQKLALALNKLPYEQKEVVLLHLEGQITFKQIASYQDTSINTVQSRYRYGLLKLKETLEE
jgi:RNA polymerase sigma-70 factor (ECF subfamily)